MKTKELKIKDEVYELVKSETTGCNGCVFRNDADKCELAGESCFKENHGKKYPMVWTIKE